MSEQKTRLLQVEERSVSYPGVRLVVQRGPDRGRALKAETEEIVVGTSPSAHLCLTDAAVSRNHFSLRIMDEGFVLTDLDSTNGTWVGDRRIRSMFIEVGDRIDIGTSRLRLEAAQRRVEMPLSQATQYGQLLGVSVAARRLFATLEQVANTDATVLLLGETGTGKDAIAAAVHEASHRAQGPFVVFDCGAVAETLIESELFGHEVGAFTGANRRRIGAFEEANGGTLFLDEIGELPKPLQSKLLRAIDRRDIQRVGGNTRIPVDIRILAATNRDLKRDVNHGLFREDLYYRLSVVNVRVPPLRERLDDVALIATHFWRQLTNDPDGELPDALRESLLLHDWPGNVRELRNVVERAAVIEHTPLAKRSDGQVSFKDAKAVAVDAFERAFLAELVVKTKGNISEASRVASIDRVHLTKLLRKHGLSPTRASKA